MKPKTFWAIRHIPTQTFMPARLPSTSCEFDAPDGVWEPRLFYSERAAKNCATCWSQGPWVKHTYTESEGWEYRSYTAEDPPRPAKTSTDRKREDLEVLAVQLTLQA